MRTSRNADLFLPQIVEVNPHPWTIHETVLDKAAVNKRDRIAEIPPPYTEAQQLARLHELMHVKISPVDFGKVREKILDRAVRNNIDLDARALGVILKMLEENRVDWVLWDRYDIDMRPCREVLDWGSMSIPDDPTDMNHVLEAAQWVLQLAWTVWASDGFPSGKVPKPPPPRDKDEETSKLFEACWRVVSQYNTELAKCIIRACLLIYNEPTPKIRDKAAYELATFFQIPPPPPPPEEKEEEKQEQAAALEIMLAIEEQRKDDEEGGVNNDVATYGYYEVHDHTRGPRRPTTKIRRKYTALDIGTVLKYPHRYLMDRMVFGRRNQTDGALMIDFSGSMNWTNDDMMACLNRMPNIWIGSYSGVTYLSGKTNIIGRICIHATKGRFNVFTGKESVNDGSNRVDLEALYWLAKQPEPRFWLSDGCVCLGKLYGVSAHLPELDGLVIPPATQLAMNMALVKEVNIIMKRARILRIPDKDTAMKLMQGRRVTLYRSTYSNRQEDAWWSGGVDLPDSPISYQL